MWTRLTIVMAALALCALAAGQAAGGGDSGTPGVQDGECWKDADGNVLEMDVEGLMTGNQRVTGTCGDNSGSTESATPDPDGGCATSGSFKVGSHTYRVKNGSMHRENKRGDWIRMSKVDCPKKNGNEAEV